MIIFFLKNCFYQKSALFFIKIKYMVPKTIEWLLMSLVAYKGDFAFLRLFGVNSGSVQSVLASYGFFRVEPFFKSDDFTECFDSQIYNKSTLC